MKMADMYFCIINIIIYVAVLDHNDFRAVWPPSFVIGNIDDNQPKITVKNPCLSNPCYNLVLCEEISNEPGYKCGTCPDGMLGDGRVCQDINEVSFI